MTDKVKLHNTHKTMQIEVYSADGDSVHILPDVKQEVDAKFNWRLPKDVVVYKEKETVFGKKKDEVVKVETSEPVKNEVILPQTPENRTTEKPETSKESTKK